MKKARRAIGCWLLYQLSNDGLSSPIASSCNLASFKNPFSEVTVSILVCFVPAYVVIMGCGTVKFHEIYLEPDKLSSNKPAGVRSVLPSKEIMPEAFMLIFEADKSSEDMTKVRGNGIRVTAYSDDTFLKPRPNDVVTPITVNSSNSLRSSPDPLEKHVRRLSFEEISSSYLP